MHAPAYLTYISLDIFYLVGKKKKDFIPATHRQILHLAHEMSFYLLCHLFIFPCSYLKRIFFFYTAMYSFCFSQKLFGHHRSSCDG